MAPTLGTVVDPFGLWSRASLAVLERTLASRWASDAVDLVLCSAMAERTVRVVFEGPLGDAAVRAAVRTGLAERLAVELLETGAAVRLLDRDELWAVVDEVARSPAVTDAIAHQGAGFAGQVAGELGERSRSADERLERFARRVLRRRPTVEEGVNTLVPTGPP